MSESNGQGERLTKLITMPGDRRLPWASDPGARFTGIPGRVRFVDPNWEGDPKSADAPLLATIEAPDLARIAASIIGRHQEAFKHLASVDVEYLWKRKGGMRGGRAVRGGVVRVSGIWKQFVDATWIVWLAADNCQFDTNWMIDANLCHQLLHTAEGEGEDGGEPVMVPHDFEGFSKELQWYGTWEDGLTTMGHAMNQLQLPMQGTIPLAEVEKATASLEGTPLGEGRPATAVEERELAAAGVGE